MKEYDNTSSCIRTYFQISSASPERAFEEESLGTIQWSFTSGLIAKWSALLLHRIGTVILQSIKDYQNWIHATVVFALFSTKRTTQNKNCVQLYRPYLSHARQIVVLFPNVACLLVLAEYITYQIFPGNKTTHTKNHNDEFPRRWSRFRQSELNDLEESNTQNGVGYFQKLKQMSDKDEWIEAVENGKVHGSRTVNLVEWMVGLRGSHRQYKCQPATEVRLQRSAKKHSTWAFRQKCRKQMISGKKQLFLKFCLLPANSSCRFMSHCTGSSG